MSKRTQKTYLDYVRPLRESWTLRGSTLNVETMWKSLGVLVLVGALAFLYLTEVSQEATTYIAIRDKKEEHLSLTRRINNLGLEIAQIQAPQAVQERAQSLGMNEVRKPDYLQIDQLPEKR